MAKKALREKVLQEAWIGDAVLCLFVRQLILDEDGKIDSPKSERMTANRFLAAIAEPSEAEAAIGRVYASEGLEAAFCWIESRILPVFRQQEANRKKREGRRA